MNKILVADRETAICMLYAEELIEEGYDVVTISNPKDFMRAVEAESPDLILLDIWMVKNGNDALRRDIRHHVNGIPIIITTTYTLFKQHLAYLPFDDIVMKGFDLSEMKAKINRLLKGLAPLAAETANRYKNQEIPIANYGAWRGHDAHHCSLRHSPEKAFDTVPTITRERLRFGRPDIVHPLKRRRIKPAFHQNPLNPGKEI